MAKKKKNSFWGNVKKVLASTDKQAMKSARKVDKAAKNTRKKIVTGSKKTSGSSSSGNKRTTYGTGSTSRRTGTGSRTYYRTGGSKASPTSGRNNANTFKLSNNRNNNRTSATFNTSRHKNNGTNTSKTSSAFRDGLNGNKSNLRNNVRDNFSSKSYKAKQNEKSAFKKTSTVTSSRVPGVSRASESQRKQATQDAKNAFKTNKTGNVAGTRAPNVKKANEKLVEQAHKDAKKTVNKIVNQKNTTGRVAGSKVPNSKVESSEKRTKANKQADKWLRQWDSKSDGTFGDYTQESTNAKSNFGNHLNAKAKEVGNRYLETADVLEIIQDKADKATSWLDKYMNQNVTPLDGAFKMAQSVDKDKANENLDKHYQNAEDARSEIQNIKDKSTTDAFDRFMYNINDTVMDMTADQLIGLGSPIGTLVSMGSRLFGDDYAKARKDGATENEALSYASLNTGKEVASEKLFGMLGLFGGYGKGVADDVVEALGKKTANALTNKVTSEGLKNIIHSGINTGSKFLTEGLEEVAADLVEPTITNKTYAEAVTKRNKAKVKEVEDLIKSDPKYQTENNYKILDQMKKSADITQSLSGKDMAYDMLMGGVIGGLFGGAEVSAQSNEGKTIKSDTSKLQKLAETAKNIDTDIEGGKQAKTIADIVSSGGNIANGQAVELQNAVQKQTEKDYNTFKTAMTSVNRVIEDRGLNEPYTYTRNDDGTVSRTSSEFVHKQAEANAELASTVVDNVIKDNKDYQIDDTDTAELKSVLTQIESGELDDISSLRMFGADNTVARTALEEMTGTRLPKSNSETVDAIVEYVGQKRIDLAEAQRTNVVDRLKGMATQEANNAYGVNTIKEFQNITDAMGNDIHTQDARDMMRTFSNYAAGAKAGIDFETIENSNNDAHNILTKEQRKAIYDASVADNEPEAVLTGVTVEQGDEISKLAEKARKEGKTVTGKVYTNELADSKRVHLDVKQMNALNTLASNLNLDIHVVDSEWMLGSEYTTKEQKEMKEAPNGFEINGAIYWNVDSDKPMMYVVGHEILHHLKTYAPNEYKELRDTLLTACIDRGRLQLGVEITTMQALYKQHGAELSREKAIEEIIANQMYGLTESETFWNALEDEKPSLARRILDAIRDILHKIRTTLMGEESFDENISNYMYESLGILTDMEELTAKALIKAKTNRLAVGEVGKNGVNYAVGETEDGNKVAIIEDKLPDRLSDSELKRALVKKLKKFKYNVVNGQAIIVGRIGHGEMTWSYDTRKLQHDDHDTFVDKMDALTGANDILQASEKYKDEKKIHNNNPFTQYGRGEVLISVNGNNYSAEVICGTRRNGICELYDVVNFTPANFKIKKDISAIGMQSESSEATSQRVSSNEIISEDDNSSNSNTSFSISNPIEESGSLVAVHNLKEADLENTLKLGGFPMPSIAIVKRDSGHNEYGSISVLFDKSTIDPEANADNEVYSGDAWTPVYPTVEYKANEKVTDRIYDKVQDIKKDKVPEGVSRVLAHFNPSNIEDELNRYRGESGLVEAYKNDIDMKNAYLADTGNAVYDVYEETEKHFRPDELKRIKSIVEELGGKEAVKDATKEEWQEAVHKATDSDKKPSPVLTMRIKNQTLRYLDTGESWTESKYNHDATVKAIEDKVNQTEYENWLKDFFNGIEEKSGIRNNKDMFTDDGSRRSFEALHYEENLENVVSAMREEENGGAMFAGQNIWSAATKKYNSIDDIRADKERLITANQEEYDNLRSEYTEKLQDIVSNIMDKDTDNDFIARDNAAECVVESVRESRNAEDIYNYLQEYPQLTVTEKDAQDIAELIENIASMPTEYFEAKPRRAVAFDEVKGVLVPDDINSELKDNIKSMGMDVYEYESGNEDDRRDKLNEVATSKNINFSISPKLESALEAVKSRTFSNEYAENDEVYIGESSDFLTNVIGADAFSVTMPQKKAYQAMATKDEAIADGVYKEDENYHGLDVDGLIKVLESAEKPLLAITNTKKFNNRIVLLTDQVDYKGKPIVVIQALGTDGNINGKRTKSNKYITSYGKKKLKQYINKLLKTEKILYYDKNNSHIIEGYGLQLSTRNDSYDYNDNIKEFWDNVNNNTDSKITADSNGRKLTKQQTDYFKDSKVRDENGNLLVMYHGTPVGDFTVFNSGSYFSDSKQYAEIYQKDTKNRDNLNPKTYEVYLNITKPFDIRNDSKARDIFINDYVKGGNSASIDPYLAESEYDKINDIDWTEADNLIEFLEEEGYDYDGLVVNEGASGGYGDNVTQYGNSYVAFYPNQVKNVNNDQPTTNPDIRYNISDDSEIDLDSVMDMMETNGDFEDGSYVPIDDPLVMEGRARSEDTIRELKNQLEELQKKSAKQSLEIEKLKTARKFDKKLTHGKVLQEKSVKPQINDLVKTIMSGYKHNGMTNNQIVNGILENSKEIFSLIQEDNLDDAVMTAFYTAEEVVDGLVLNDDGFFNQYKDLKEELRTTRIEVPEYVRNDMGDYSDFRKSNAGRLRLVSEEIGGRPIDTYYQELLELYPDLFTEDITNEVDQLQKISEVAESIRVYELALTSEESTALAQQIGNDLMDIIYDNGESKTSFADRKKQQYNDMVAKMRVRKKEAIAKVRENKNNEMKRKVQKVRSAKDEQLQKVRDKRDEKLKTQREEIRASEKEKRDELRERKDEQIKEVRDTKNAKLKEVREKRDEALADLMQSKKDAKTKLRNDRDTKLAEQKQKYKDKEQKRRESARRRELHKKINKNVKWLADRALKPSKEKPCPEILRKPIGNLIASLDTQTKVSKDRAERIAAKNDEPIRIPKAVQKFSELKEALRDMTDERSGKYDEVWASYFDDQDLEMIDEIKKFANDNGEIVFSELSDDELETIHKLFRALKTQIGNMNRAFAEDQKKTISELGEQVMSDCDAFKAKFPNRKHDGWFDDIFNGSFVSGIDMFELLGDGMKEIWKPLRKALDTNTIHMREASEFFSQFTKPKWNKRSGTELDAWRVIDPKDSENTKTYTNSAGQTVTLCTAQKMELYLGMKRQQTLGHLLGSGFVVEDLTEDTVTQKVFGKKASKKVVSGRPIRFTQAELEEIVNDLTDEQKAMADAIQNYLATTVADWGNEVSMKMYGYEMFDDMFYFPIKTQKEFLNADFEKQARNAQETIKNFGFTKAVKPNSTNPIVIGDVFSTAMEHIAKMSLYNAYAPAISDFTRVYNYKTKDASKHDNGSVKLALAEAYGKKVNQFIARQMADIQEQNSTFSDGYTKMIDKLIGNSMKASIAANIRVALQQPTAGIRALQYISPKYFATMNHTPWFKKQLDKDDLTDIQEMIKYCPIAQRKAWGFSQVNMGRGIEDIIMNNWSMLDTATTGIYGQLDLWTWSKIWKAVKAETKDLHSDVEYGSNEFWDICNERASYIYDHSQVVDSPLHRTQVMRNKDKLVKSTTAFLSEPMRTYNMLRTEVVKMHRGETPKFKGSMRMISVFVASQFATAIAQSLGDALRQKDDDDDDKPDPFFQLLWNNFKTDVNPANLLPVLNQIDSWREGWGNSNYAFDGIADIVQDADKVMKSLTGESDDSVFASLWEVVKDASSVTGVPIKSFCRDANALLQLVGIDVFASTSGDESEEQSWFETMFGWATKAVSSGSDSDSDSSSSSSSSSSGKSSGSSSSSSDSNKASKEDIDYGIYDDSETETNSSLGDKVSSWLYKASGGDWGTDPKVLKKQRETEAYKERIKELKALGDDDKIYSKATRNYTKMIEAGDFNTIAEMRKTIKDAGGKELAEKFDEGVERNLKTTFKKQIGEGGDSKLMAKCWGALENDYGYTQGQISEIAKSSDTAKKFQEAAALGKTKQAQKYVEQLGNAGLTQEDLDSLYEKRWNAIDAKTTGTFAIPAKGTISSGYGQRWGTLHAGIDIAMPNGTTVSASDGGTVIATGYNSALGNYVDIKHSNGYISRYQHLTSYSVEKGQKVKKSQEIAKSGSTGNVTGAHLHFALYRGTSESDTTHANSVNPYKYLYGNKNNN